MTNILVCIDIVNDILDKVNEHFSNIHIDRQINLSMDIQSENSPIENHDHNDIDFEFNKHHQDKIDESTAVGSQQDGDEHEKHLDPQEAGF
jgi:hypothetical protein